MFPSKLIANVIKIIHYIIMFTLLLGVFLPSKYLIYYIFLWPAVYFHWYFNDNKCMLTELESHFDTKYPNVNIHEEVIHHKYVEIFENFKKLNIYLDNIDLFTSRVYNIVIIFWVVSFIRLLNHYKKNIYHVWLSIKKPLSVRLVSDNYK